MNTEQRPSEPNSLPIWRQFWALVFERVAKTPMPLRRRPRLARTDSDDITDPLSPDAGHRV